MSFRRLERIMLKTRQSRSDPLPDPMTSGSGDSRRVDKQELAQLFASHTLSPQKRSKRHFLCVRCNFGWIIRGFLVLRLILANERRNYVTCLFTFITIDSRRWKNEVNFIFSPWKLVSLLSYCLGTRSTSSFCVLTSSKIFFFFFKQTNKTKRLGRKPHKRSCKLKTT